MRQRYIIHWSDNKATYFTLKRNGILSIADYQRIGLKGKEERDAVPVSIQRFPI